MTSGGRRLIEDPIVILAAPRSGSSLLFGMLSAHPALWSLYRESNPLFEGPFHPRERAWTSNALDERDLSPEVSAELHRAFYREAGNLERLPLGRLVPLRGRGKRSISRAIAIASRPFKRAPIRLVEKSPRNTLRVAFLRELFPDARFIHLVRDPRSNIASIYRAWRTPGRYKTYPMPDGFNIVGYDESRWSFMLQPGWRDLDGASLMEVCADQWRACNASTIDGLRDISEDRWVRVTYEQLIADPASQLSTIASWADLDPAPFARFATDLPVIQAQQPPDARRWLALKEDLDRVAHRYQAVASTLGYR